jgi:hypothetical protein
MFCIVCGQDLREQDGKVLHLPDANYCPISHTDMAKQHFSNIDTAAGILDRLELSK